MDFFMDDDFGSPSDYSTGPVVPDPMDCMRCGLCLRQCPTFQLTNDEQEGPRQRIRTLEKMVIQQAPVSVEAIEHLNNCTQCRACESVCPSQMDYHVLFNQAQQQLNEPKSIGLLAKLGLKCIEHKSLKQVLLPFAWAYQIPAVKQLVNFTKLLKFWKLETLARFNRWPVLKTMAGKRAASTEPVGKVALFTGCISESFDRQTLEDAVTVLTKMGYEVIIPATQVCCGAIHAHQGDMATASALMQQNRSTFNAMDVDAIVYCTSGCGVELHDYANWLALDEEPAFGPPLFEVMDFVAKHWDDARLNVRPAFKRVLVHEPCSHRNVLKTQQSIYAVLHKIPGLMVKALEDNHLCCGAGGVYMLTHPEPANAMRKAKLSAFDHQTVDFIVSTNIGCALHLATEHKNGKAIDVRHPITVLASKLSVIQ